MLVREMMVKDVMKPCTITLNQDALIKEAWVIMRNAGAQGLPVVDNNGKLVGIFTNEHFFKSGPECLHDNVTVSTLMERDFISVNACLPLIDVWRMSKNIFPVIEENHNLIGILERLDIAPALYQGSLKLLEQVNNILDSAHNAIVAVNKDGIVTLFNQSAVQITRRPKEQAVGNHLSQVVIPQGLLEILKYGKSLKQYKFTVSYSQGVHTYITNRTPITENGEVVGAVGVFQDISDIEFISEELNAVKQLNKELQAIIESSYDGILVTAPDGMIIKANKAYERITGNPVAEFQGKSIYNLENVPTVRLLVEEVVKNNKTITLWPNTEKNKHLLITGNPIYNDKKDLIKIVINIRDLTELNQLKQQLFESNELSQRHQQELNHLRTKISKHDDLIFYSPCMQNLHEVISRVAQVDSTVLILGESGVGKEVAARLLHKYSQRASGPFITVNCGAIPENLLESELFGYERGAFTGANREGKAGLFEIANNGTLFLDEIADLPLHFQVKLLRAIQSKEITRVGGTQPKSIDVRILTATNKDLEQMVKEESFREDLYFRINVVPLNIPPLRERKQDIIPLTYKSLKTFNMKYNANKELEPDVLDVFLDYSWPGNVRELENLIERLLVTSPGSTIRISDLPAHIYAKRLKQTMVSVHGILPLKLAQLEMERQLIKNALSEYSSTCAVAKALQVDQSTIVRKLQRIKKFELNGKLA